MLTAIHPKLPMRNKLITREYYIKNLCFKEFGNANYDAYLMLEKDDLQIHFFEFKDINISENYGQVYIRMNDIDNYYNLLLKNKVKIHPNGKLELKPWHQKEFSLLDPDNNLLTFGESI